MHSVKSSSLTSADDLPFQHYSRRHRAIAWISRHLFDHFKYTVRHGLIRGMRRKGGLGWIPAFLLRRAQTKEEIFWRELRLQGLVVYDVGAFHGILTLFFASGCSQVISYEPNEINHARLIENIRSNNLGNVQVPIQVTTLDRDIAEAALPAPDLIKIDIEGWELEALQGARETLAAHHPALFLEMHGETKREKRRKASAIVAFLCDAGYTDIRHVETGATIAPSDETVAAEGHLYCLCPTNTSSRLPVNQAEKASSA
jgi:hypothetical protein